MSILPVKHHKLVLQQLPASLKTWKDTSTCEILDVHTIWMMQTCCVMIICWFKSLFQFSMTGCILVRHHWTSPDGIFQIGKCSCQFKSLLHPGKESISYPLMDQMTTWNMKDNTVTIFTYYAFKASKGYIYITDSVVKVLIIKSGGDCEMLFSNVHIYKTYGLIHTYMQIPL